MPRRVVSMTRKRPRRSCSVQGRRDPTADPSLRTASEREFAAAWRCGRSDRCRVAARGASPVRPAPIGGMTRDARRHDPRRRGRRRDEDVPGRQPHRRRLRAARRRDRPARAAPAGDALPRPRARRPRPARRVGLRRPAPRARGRRHRVADRSGHAARPAHGPRRRARPRARVRARGRRLRVQALLLPRAPRPRGGAAAPGGRPPAAAAACGSGELEIDPPGADARSCAASRSRSPRRSSRCCGRSPATPCGCSRRTSSCASCGASGTWGRRGRWTRTPAACGASSASTATSRRERVGRRLPARRRDAVVTASATWAWLVAASTTRDGRAGVARAAARRASSSRARATSCAGR